MASECSAQSRAIRRYCNLLLYFLPNDRLMGKGANKGGGVIGWHSDRAKETTAEPRSSALVLPGL